MIQASSLLHRLSPSWFLVPAAVLLALAVFVVAGGAPPAQAGHKAPTPTNVQATVLSATSVKLTWDGPAASRQYSIQWSEHPGGATQQRTITCSTNGGTRTFSGLTPDTTYRFRVLTVGGSGHADSDYSGWATATTATVLVSNTGRTDSPAADGPGASLCAVNAQGFTTGSNPGGYTLTSIGLVVTAVAGVDAAAEVANMKAELWSDDGNGDAGTKLADLTAPSTISTGEVSFVAPANTTLDANSTYHFVLYSTRSNGALRLDSTLSNDEDSGSAVGWSIADAGRRIGGATSVSGTWGDAGDRISFRIKVNGHTVSTDLSALTAESSAGGNTFAALTLSPAFDAGATGYRATVGNSVTHVRLTPTAAGSGSSVKVGKPGATPAPVASGSASGAIALDVGDNEITVRVAASNGAARDYTVTVRRAPAGSVWWATLAPQQVQTQGPVALGCSSALGAAATKCSNTDVLTNDDVPVGMRSYAIHVVSLRSGALSFDVLPTARGSLMAMNLCVGSTRFALSALSATTTVWTSSGLAWTEGVPVSLSIGTSCGQEQDPPPNRAPTVSSAIADAVIVNESGTRWASLSGVFSDPDSDSLTISAASSNDAVVTASVAADYATLTVTARSRGTATITLTADDGNGGAVSDTFTVRVKAAPVVASAIGDVSGLTAGTTREASLSGVFRDADGDALTITAASSNSAIAAVSVAADRTRLTVEGVAEGAATITVTAQDSDGNRVSDAFRVEVVRPPEPEERETADGAPIVVAPVADFGLEGSKMRDIDLTEVFSDPAGDELTFSAKSSNYRVAALWSIDGLGGSTLRVVAAGTGTATITVTARDPDGNEVSDSFEVTVRPFGG